MVFWSGRLVFLIAFASALTVSSTLSCGFDVTFIQTDKFTEAVSNCRDMDECTDVVSNDFDWSRIREITDPKRGFLEIPTSKYLSQYKSRWYPPYTSHYKSRHPVMRWLDKPASHGFSRWKTCVLQLVKSAQLFSENPTFRGIDVFTGVPSDAKDFHLDNEEGIAAFVSFSLGGTGSVVRLTDGGEVVVEEGNTLVRQCSVYHKAGSERFQRITVRLGIAEEGNEHVPTEELYGDGSD